jgi:hypothetical protein
MLPKDKVVSTEERSREESSNISPEDLLKKATPDLGYDRKKVLMSCLFSLLTTQTLFLNVENVLPTYIPDTFPK